LANQAGGQKDGPPAPGGLVGAQRSIHQEPRLTFGWGWPQGKLGLVEDPPVNKRRKYGAKRKLALDRCLPDTASL
jgi:hypothetical protein